MQQKLLFGPFLVLLVTAGLSGCNAPQHETAKATVSAAQSAALSPVEVPAKNCQMKAFTQSYGLGKQIFTFDYKGSILQQVNVKADGQEAGQQVVYSYDGQGRVDSIRARPGKSFLKYIYDAHGKLVRIEAGGSFMPRKFSYNSQGQLNKQETVFNQKPFTTTEYTYDAQGNAVEARIFDQSGKPEQTLTFRYDDKANPMVHSGALVNGLEILYGYPVANSLHNLVEVTTTYHKNPGYRVNGEEIKTGSKQTKAMVYAYNQQGYLVSLNKEKTAIGWQYTCQ